jgi:hypothetical protein
MEARKPEFFSATDMIARSDRNVVRRTYKGQECEYTIHMDINTSITQTGTEGFLKYYEIFTWKWLCGFDELDCNEIRDISLSHLSY